MAKFLIISLFTLAVTVQPCLAKKMPKHVPQVGKGESQGVDPEVERFQKSMEETKAELAAIQTSILATQIPAGTKIGAMMGGVKAAQEFAATAAVMAKANAAHKRFIAHMMGYKGDNVDEELGIKAPKFGSKNDDTSLKQKKDYTLKGRRGSGAKSRRSPLGPQAAKGAGSGRPQMKLNSMSGNPVSYGATTGGLDSNFASMSHSRISGAGAVGNASAGTVTGGSALSGVSGGGSAVGGASGLSESSGDVETARNDMNRINKKTIEQIDAHNKQIKERQEKAKKGMSPEQLAGMAGPAMAAAGQAMKGAEKGAGGCKNCGKQKANEASTKEKAAPA